MKSWEHKMQEYVTVFLRQNSSVINLLHLSIYLVLPAIDSSAVTISVPKCLCRNGRNARDTVAPSD